jgi:hypothetical protein
LQVVTEAKLAAAAAAAAAAVGRHMSSAVLAHGLHPRQSLWRVTVVTFHLSKRS